MGPVDQVQEPGQLVQLGFEGLDLFRQTPERCGVAAQAHPGRGQLLTGQGHLVLADPLPRRSTRLRQGLPGTGINGRVVALRSNPYLALKNISCYLFDGVLVLRGCLPTYYLKQIAQAAVASMKGVRRIDNQIQVVRETPQDQVKLGVFDTDAGGEESRREISPNSDRRTPRGVKVTAPFGEEIEVDG
jgi:hypothetical protein